MYVRCVMYVTSIAGSVFFGLRRRRCSVRCMRAVGIVQCLYKKERAHRACRKHTGHTYVDCNRICHDYAPVRAMCYDYIGHNYICPRKLWPIVMAYIVMASASVVEEEASLRLEAPVAASRQGPRAAVRSRARAGMPTLRIVYIVMSYIVMARTAHCLYSYGLYSYGMPALRTVYIVMAYIGMACPHCALFI